MKNISSAYGKYARVSLCACVRVRVHVYWFMYWPHCHTVQIYTKSTRRHTNLFYGIDSDKIYNQQWAERKRAPKSCQSIHTHTHTETISAHVCHKQQCPAPPLPESGQQQTLRIRSVSPFYLTAIEAVSLLPPLDTSYLCCFYGPCTILLFYFSMQCLAVTHTRTHRKRERGRESAHLFAHSLLLWVRVEANQCKQGLEYSAIVWTAWQATLFALSLFLSVSLSPLLSPQHNFSMIFPTIVVPVCIFPARFVCAACLMHNMKHARTHTHTHSYKMPRYGTSNHCKVSPLFSNSRLRQLSYSLADPSISWLGQQ